MSDATADGSTDAGDVEATVDVTVVGAGVVGCAIARELTAHGLRVLLVEARNDVGAGTSKANTAIWHTGFDAKPGTLEARMVRRGHHLLSERAITAGWPLLRCGAVLVAWDNEQLARLPVIAANAHEVGYPHITALSADEVYAREPHLGPGARGGLLVPDEGLLDPWAVTLNLATEAVINGAQLWRSSPVTGVTPGSTWHQVRCGSRQVRTRWVVDAAGLDSDVVDGWFGHTDFTVTPRRGQLIVFDKLARRLLTHIVLPVPTATTKGVLVSPTVYGNVLLGPTAEDLDDRSATQTSHEGLQALMAQGRRILPSLLDEEVTATYAGLRAATEHSDYQYGVFADERYVRVGGIRSTGVSGSLALAEQLVSDLADAGVAIEPVVGFRTWGVPDLSEGDHRPYLDERLIAGDAASGRIVCHCERVTEREVTQALSSPVPPADAAGLKRRTRVLMGRCQGFYCGATVARLLDAAPDPGALGQEGRVG